MSASFENKMKELVSGTALEFKRCTEYHYQLKGIFLINIYPSKSKYYTQGSESGIRYTSLQDLIDICTGDKNMPKATVKTERKHLSAKKPALWEKSKHCFFCGDRINSLSEATVEHKVPLSRGGSNRIDNLALSHDQCNQERKNDLHVQVSVNEMRLIEQNEKLRIALNTCKNDYWFMSNLIERYGSNKDQTLKDCLERMKFRKGIFEILEPLNAKDKG